MVAMDLRLALAAYVLPGLAIVLGIPMVLGAIPPNRFYGYRTRKTLGSTAIWYQGNRAAGWSMVLCGAAALGHNLYLLHSHPEWPSDLKQIFMTVSAAVLLFAGLIFSGFYIRKLR